MKCVIGIQARSNSKRFPGKALIEIVGIPLISWVIESCKRTGIPVWLLTSDEPSDDRLVEYSKTSGTNVFRGSLNSVWNRYHSFLNCHDYSRVIRINGDSPLISSHLITRAAQVVSENEDYDLITNVYPRTFPKGQSVEVINSTILYKTPTDELLPRHQEHLTSYLYENSKNYRIRNFENDIDLSSVNLCVDTPEDRMKIEHFLLDSGIKNPLEIPDWSQLSKLLQEWKGR